MPAPKILLLDVLENLGDYDFEKFKMHLNEKISDRWKPIPRSFLDSASRIDTAKKMVSSYGEESVILAVEILRLICNNQAAEDLEKAYKGGEKPAASTSSSAAAAPAAPEAAAPQAAAPAAISAQGGSVVFAPTLMGGTSGAWNVTINK